MKGAEQLHGRDHPQVQVEWVSLGFSARTGVTAEFFQVLYPKRLHAESVRSNAIVNWGRWRKLTAVLVVGESGFGPWPNWTLRPWLGL